MAGKKFDITKFAATLPEAVPESGMTREIPVGDILDNPRNFYPRPDNNTLGALMESIQANGLLEPPTVVPAEDGKYRLISGHSRMAALRLLAANRDEAVAKQFSTVLCRVLPAMAEEQELCAVIEANRQRVKSNALLAQEAEKLKESYIRRKKAGEAFPVGLRDWIAKEMQINATKVGNLQVIKKGLKVPGIIARWEKGELPEAAALEIARMDDETQYRLLDWVIDHCRTWSINNVREFSTCWTCCKHKCPDTGGFCPNAARMYADRYRYGEWRCAGCCRECLNRDTCSTACRFVVAERPPKEPEPAVPRNPAADDPRLKNMTPKFCERVKWENNSFAGAGSLPKLALTLGTTMDYLCGLTDDPAPKPPTLFSVDLCSPVWLPLDAEHWPTEGALVALSYETGLGGSSYLVARCAGHGRRHRRVPLRPLDAACRVRPRQGGRMKNAYAKEQAELRRQLLNYGALVGQQFNVDMMCLALNEEGFGHDRIMRIIHRAEKHGEYFYECLAYGVESDARFEQLDQRLRYICRDHPEDFVPREERYPNVKVPGMGKKFKAEPIGG